MDEFLFYLSVISIVETALVDMPENPIILFFADAPTSNGLITTFTSAIKLAIKLTIKLKSYCSYNKQHFVVATTKMLMRAATVVRRSIAVDAQDSAAEHCDGSRLRG